MSFEKAGLNEYISSREQFECFLSRPVTQEATRSVTPNLSAKAFSISSCGPVPRSVSRRRACAQPRGSTPDNSSRAPNDRPRQLCAPLAARSSWRPGWLNPTRREAVAHCELCVAWRGTDATSRPGKPRQRSTHLRSFECFSESRPGYRQRSTTGGKFGPANGVRRQSASSHLPCARRGEPARLLPASP